MTPCAILTDSMLHSNILILCIFPDYRNISKKQIVILNLSSSGECGTDVPAETGIVPVKVLFIDSIGHYDNTLADTFISLWQQDKFTFDFPVSKTLTFY